MKKLLILLLIISACKKEVYYYPSEEFFKEYSPKEIVIKNLNYGVIVDSLTNQIFKKERHFIKIETSNRIYKISPFTYAGGLIKEINSLEIENDSLWWEFKKQPLNNLIFFIESHYGNNGKEYYLPYSYKRAFVKLTLDSTESNKKVRNCLLHIIKSYEKAEFKYKDSCNLDVLIDFKRKPKYGPKPPPPSPLEIVD